MKNLLSFIFCVTVVSSTYAQEITDPQSNEYYNWFNQSFDKNGVMGVKTQEAYQLVKNRKSSTVIVAVLDDGVDIKHPDLIEKIWSNTDEVAGNGIDDDKNGYVDDVAGWNFLGNAKGESVSYDNLEAVRIVKKFREKFAGKTEYSIAEKDKKDFAIFNKAKVYLNKKTVQAKDQMQQIPQLMRMLTFSQQYVADKKGVSTYHDSLLTNFEAGNQQEANILEFLKYAQSDNLDEKGLKEYLHHLQDQLNYNLSLDFNSRDSVNYTQSDYGNAFVDAKNPEHGTHVAGIIAANRNNDIGVKGVANNVLIMPVRVVPQGDERDEDVAKAIRYAVDNGAQIINMSFGKAFSIQPQLVKDAIAYADSKGVIMVHAAGNDGMNTDIEKNYPNAYINGETKAPASLFLNIGANTAKKDETLVANFSNYGKTQVHVFAPGHNILSLKPNNDYAVNQGTSMAAPVVSGCLAFLKSYFPNATSHQVLEALMSTVQRADDIEVNRPISEDENIEEGVTPKVLFKDTSVSGGVVDLLAATQKLLNK